ncbi:hypothetical protein SAMN04489807_1342 [Microbacterium hydrocarbonoxydans]|uniref:Lipoprotein n=2 Tax=Microbacterium hydrocarbonoxydans TaxID=273678 RepID=A0A1H4KCG0_9MICO|nr:hypothetical protein SAMN04489807_1342 [Microbacterium hydrocarbonoxydans]
MQKSAKCRRRIAVINGLVALVACLLLACAPAPAPTPSPTPAFASEEAAFEAAEEVYRAYNDALNARSAGTSGADPHQYLTGLALEGDIDTQTLLLSSGMRVTGAAMVESFVGESADMGGSASRVIGVACIDVSSVVLLDESGANVTPPERGDKIAQRIVFTGSAESMLIADESVADVSAC